MNVSPADGEQWTTQLLATRLLPFCQAQLNEQALQQVQQQQQLQAQLNQKALDQAERMCAVRDAAVMCGSADVLKVAEAAEAAEAAQAMQRAAQEAQEPAQLQEQQPSLATAPKPSTAAVAGLTEEEEVLRLKEAAELEQLRREQLQLLQQELALVEEEDEEQQPREAAAILLVRQQAQQQTNEENLRRVEEAAYLRGQQQALVAAQAQRQATDEVRQKEALEDVVRQKALDAANSRVAQMERERQLLEQKGAREAEKLKVAREALAKKEADLKRGLRAEFETAMRAWHEERVGLVQAKAGAQEKLRAMWEERNTALSEASAWESRFSEQNLETSSMLEAGAQRGAALEARLHETEERCQAEVAARIEAQSHREEQAVRIEHSLNQQAAA